MKQQQIQTQSNKLPKGWEEYKLGDYCRYSGIILKDKLYMEM